MFTESQLFQKMSTLEEYLQKVVTQQEKEYFESCD